MSPRPGLASIECFAFVALLACLAPAAALGCSECQCGNPLPHDFFGDPEPVRFRYGLEERYMSKENALAEEPGRESQSENRIALFALARIGSQVTLLGRLPYTVKRLEQTPEAAATEITRTQGLGDAELVGRAQITSVDGARWSRPAIAAVLGTSAPTGDNERANDAGERLDEHVQPGRGAWSGTAGLDLVAPINAGSWTASLLARANGTNADRYHYGNILLYDAAFTSNRHGSWQWIAALQGRTSKSDQHHTEEEPNTGGTAVYGSPGVRWLGFAGLAVDVSAQFPMIQSLHGDQTEHATVRAAVSIAQ
jgi:hypothetical protein